MTNIGHDVPGDSAKRPAVKAKMGDGNFMIDVSEKRLLVQLPVPLIIQLSVLIMITALAAAILWSTYIVGSKFEQRHFDQVIEKLNTTVSNEQKTQPEENL